MSLQKMREIVPDAMQAINRMIEKGEREIRKARTVTGDRGTIRVKRKRARQLTLALKR